MHTKIKDCDIAITRCGASDLSDLLFFNITFLAIPFPYAKDNHQYYNAKYFSDLDCCWLLDQNDLNSEKILDILLIVIDDKNDYLTKKKNIEKISPLNSWETINKDTMKKYNPKFSRNFTTILPLSNILKIFR